MILVVCGFVIVVVVAERSLSVALAYHGGCWSSGAAAIPAGLKRGRSLMCNNRPVMLRLSIALFKCNQIPQKN